MALQQLEADFPSASSSILPSITLMLASSISTPYDCGMSGGTPYMLLWTLHSKKLGATRVAAASTFLAAFLFFLNHCYSCLTNVDAHGQSGLSSGLYYRHVWFTVPCLSCAKIGSASSCDWQSPAGLCGSDKILYNLSPVSN